jgi:hypothetical protein
VGRWVCHGVVHFQVAVEERAGPPQRRTVGLNGEHLAASWRALGRDSGGGGVGGGGCSGHGGDWGEAEAYALLVHADQVSHVVSHCEGVGQWRLAAALGSRVASGGIRSGVVTQTQADACVAACEGTLRRALAAALAATPLRFDAVAEVAATAEMVAASAAVRTELTRSALAQLTLCAEALCKAAPLQPTLPLDVDVVDSTGKAAAAAATQRAVADGLRQCFAAAIRVVLPHLPPSGVYVELPPLPFAPYPPPSGERAGRVSFGLLWEPPSTVQRCWCKCNVGCEDSIDRDA